MFNINSQNETETHKPIIGALDVDDDINGMIPSAGHDFVRRIFYNCKNNRNSHTDHDTCPVDPQVLFSEPAAQTCMDQRYKSDCQEQVLDHHPNILKHGKTLLRFLTWQCRQVIPPRITCQHERS